MNSTGWLLESSPAHDHQQELLDEAERARILDYAEALAPHPGAASLLLAAWLRAAADQLAPVPRARRAARA